MSSYDLRPQTREEIKAADDKADREDAWSLSNQYGVSSERLYDLFHKWRGVAWFNHFHVEEALEQIPSRLTVCFAAIDLTVFLFDSALSSRGVVSAGRSSAATTSSRRLARVRRRRKQRRQRYVGDGWPSHRSSKSTSPAVPKPGIARPTTAEPVSAPTRSHTTLPAVIRRLPSHGLSRQYTLRVRTWQRLD